MPWNWDGSGTKSVEVGGQRGSVQDATQSKTWPTYEAAYLANALGGPAARDAAYQNKYTLPGLPGTNPLQDNEAVRNAYLDKMTANYKEEADECLKKEFSDWLQGTHVLNDSTHVYPNDGGQMQRKFVFKGDEYGMRRAPGGGWGRSGQATETMSNWSPTWWGKGQLTHLPGVREYLREDATHAEEQTFAMNLLAEFGPQNIDQAWAYFKHWVKGRPMSEATCLHRSGDLDDTFRSPIADVAPDSLHSGPPLLGFDPANVPPELFDGEGMIKNIGSRAYTVQAMARAHELGYEVNNPDDNWVASVQEFEQAEEELDMGVAMMEEGNVTGDKELLHEGSSRIDKAGEMFDDLRQKLHAATHVVVSGAIGAAADVLSGRASGVGLTLDEINRRTDRVQRIGVKSLVGFFARTQNERLTFQQQEKVHAVEEQRAEVRPDLLSRPASPSVLASSSSAAASSSSSSAASSSAEYLPTFENSAAGQLAAKSPNHDRYKELTESGGYFIVGNSIYYTRHTGTKWATRKVCEDCTALTARIMNHERMVEENKKREEATEAAKAQKGRVGLRGRRGLVTP